LKIPDVIILARDHVVAAFPGLLGSRFDPPVKNAGRYYGFPSTDKQNLDLNVNGKGFVNNL
jgi:hypothetical protein